MSIELDAIFGAVVDTFCRLRPYGEQGDPRLKGAALSDDVCLQVAACIVEMAHYPPAPPPAPDEDAVAAEEEEGLA
jgi:hypothetical protein